MEIVSRTLWFVAGAASGAYTLIKARRTAQKFSPDGIGARVAAVGVGARMFADEVAAGMSRREEELRAELLASTPSRPALAPSAPSPEPLTAGGTPHGHQ
jgi:hypothetical protein